MVVQLPASVRVGVSSQRAITGSRFAPHGSLEGNAVHAKNAKRRSASVAKKRVPARAAAKTIRSTAAKAVRSAARRKSTVRRQWPVDPRAMVLGCVCVVAVTALMAIPRWSAKRIAQVDATDHAAAIEPDTTFSDVSSLTPGPARVPKTTPTPKTEPAAAAPKSLEARSLAASSMAAPSAAAAAESPATTLAAASANEEQDATRATISGCLAYDDDAYMLKNTSGEAAPQSRSWKSGFFKKRSSSVELLDEGQRFRLASHVGQRVETAGILIDRELRVRSLRVLGSCDA
jgi:hypothetical protein